MGHSNGVNPQKLYTTYRAAVLLLLSEGESHGYALQECLVELGFARPDSASLYRILRGMEKDGHLIGVWDTSRNGGPLRRVYTITDTGIQYLATLMEDVRRQQAVIANVLQRYGALQPEGQSAS